MSAWIRIAGLLASLLLVTPAGLPSAAAERGTGGREEGRDAPRSGEVPDLERLKAQAETLCTEQPASSARMRCRKRKAKCLLLISHAEKAGRSKIEECLVTARRESRMREDDYYTPSQGIPDPRRIHRVAPRIPEEARGKNLEGRVILGVHVDRKGEVVNVEILKSAPPFDEAAVEAARQWRYEPAIYQGRPVKFMVPAVIKFKVE